MGTKTITTFGGAKRDRTADLLHAMQALSQLSYGPSVESAYYTVILCFDQLLLPCDRVYSPLNTTQSFLATQ